MRDCRERPAECRNGGPSPSRAFSEEEEERGKEGDIAVVATGASGGVSNRGGGAGVAGATV